MEVKFESREHTCLHSILQETGTGEQTQEIKLPDGMPDVGQVIAAWGQPILRGKEWRNDSISFNGGMMVWVLYRAEDGSTEKCIDAWVPFQMKWELPALSPEGSIRLRCFTRFVDARPVSPRKIMVRCGMGAMVQAMAKTSFEVYGPGENPENVELLQATYPVRLPREMGEKTFLIDEELSVPDSLPTPKKLMYYRMEPKITDRKVLGSKLVFRGQGMLHVLYASQDGHLTGWDFEVPFSQYAELENEHGTDAQVDIDMAVTSLELDLEENGSLRLKAGVTAQYLITDKLLLETIEDAYSPGRDVTLNSRMLDRNVVLDQRRELLTGEETLGEDAVAPVDGTFLWDFPRQMRTEQGIDLEVPGMFQSLYYDGEGTLRSASNRWEGNLQIPADENSNLSPRPGVAQVQTGMGSSGVQMKLELPVDIFATADQGFPMVTGVELGQSCARDPGRPSLILRRSGTKRLWDIAKDSGSTVEAIRQANGIQGEPAPGQMLLIPVP